MNNEKLERFSKLKQELESMAKSIFESISNMLVEEVVEHNLKLKLDDKIKEKIYKARAKVNKYFKSLKLDADELKAGWQYWSDLCVQNKHEVESKIQWLAGNYDIPLIQTSSFPPNIKDIESTQTKLQSGRELHDFKLKLHDFWQKQLPHWLKTSKFNPYATFEQSFITAFQCCKQVIGKFFTVGIEGNNCRIRHRIRRGFRRSCNFSKKLENHFKAFDLTFFYLNNGFV